MAKEIVALLTELTVGFAREVSGERVLDRVRAIRRSDIWPSFDRYLDTAQYLSAELQKAGCEQVEVLR